VSVVVVGTTPTLPGLPTGDGILVDRSWLLERATTTARTAPILDEWWFAVDDAGVPGLIEDVRATEIGTLTAIAEERATATDGPLRVGLQAALWIVTFAATALAVAGFAMSATVSVRMRQLELARLQALGAARTGLVRSVLLEHLLLGTLALTAGLALGALLGATLSPLLTVGVGGALPVPEVVVAWPWLTQAVLVGGTCALVGGAVALTTAVLLKRASATLLRLGDDR